MLGLGGGVVYIPLQILFGIPYHRAAATSLFLVIISSISATSIFARTKKIDWKLVAIVEVVMVIGGFIGGFYSSAVSPSALSLIFAVLVSIAGLLMLRKTRTPSSELHRGFLCWTRVNDEVVYSVSLGSTLPGVFIVGFFSNLAGLGGGVFLVPLLTIVGRVPMQIAIGSSACMVGITAMSGFIGHFAAGHFELQTAILLGMVVLIGSQIGARLSTKADRQQLQRLFAFVSIGLGAFMFYQAFTGVQ